jgi:transmembrane sensor
MASASLSVVPLDAASTLVWKDALGAHAVVGVEGSGARCDVAAAGTRDVRVETGPVSVLADDAAFVVERSAGSDHVRVSVARGRVRVMWALNEASLAAGDSETFPRDVIATVAPAEGSPGAESPRTLESSGTPRGPTPRASRSSTPATPPSTAGWRDLAQQGSYDAAYAELGREGGPKDDVNDLLLAADVARLGHHPADATSPLRQILDAHRTDPRASLAAFTLGRVLLNQLGDPGSAADAFATVRSLSPGDALAQDALAREVESRAKAGQGDAARRLAEEYIQSFPASSRADAVRRLGGIE